MRGCLWVASLALVCGASWGEAQYDLASWYTADFAQGAVRRFEGAADLAVRYEGVADWGSWPVHRLVSTDKRAAGVTYLVDPATGRVCSRRTDTAARPEGRVADMISPGKALAEGRRELAAYRSPALLSKQEVAVTAPGIVEQAGQAPSYTYYSSSIEVSSWRTIDSPFGPIEVPGQKASVAIDSRDGKAISYHEFARPCHFDWAKALPADAVRRAALGWFNRPGIGYAEGITATPLLEMTARSSEVYRLIWWVSVGYRPVYAAEPPCRDGAAIELDRGDTLKVDGVTGEVLIEESTPMWRGKSSTVKDLAGWRALPCPERAWSLSNNVLTVLVPQPELRDGQLYLESGLAWQAGVRVLQQGDGVCLMGRTQVPLRRDQIWVRGRQVWLTLEQIAKAAGVKAKFGEERRAIDLPLPKGP